MIPDTPADAPVLFERQGDHVALVTLNRPDKRNAVNPELASALEAIVRGVEAELDIRAVILASSHPTVFCAGADLGAIAAGKGVGIETAAGGFAGLVYAPRFTPWIAAIEGAAFGGGFELALGCDMIVASHTARFGLPEVKHGLLAGAGGVHRLAAMLPRNIANELIATGEPVDAAFAHRFGLANRLVAPGEAIAAARMLADTIAAHAPLAVQYSLAAARASLGLPDGAGRAAVVERFAMLRRSDDFKEGPRAFVEKRAPVWTGR